MNLNKFSSKPLLLTARDGLVMALITVLVILLIGFTWYFATGNLAYMAGSEYWFGIMRSFAGAFIMALAYEYSGFNAKLCAESMRYATGSTLQKYTSRNAALVAETLAGESLPYAPHVRAMVKATRVWKYIMRGMDYDTIVRRYGDVIDEDELAILRTIPADAMPAVPRLCELFGKNPDLIKWIATNGFDAVRARANMYGELTLDINALANTSGIKIST